MIRLRLTDEDRTAVRAVRTDRTLSPAERDRVEMVLLSDAGWAPPRIAAHLGYCAATVRTVLVGCSTGGPAGLRRKRPGPPKDAERATTVTTALDRLLGQDRTWTAAQLAAALASEGIALSTRQTRRYLQAMGARWRRTVPSLAHKQDPAKVARAEVTLTALNKKPRLAALRSATSTRVASVPASR